MVKVSPYEQDQLMSSAVGTPGVDTSKSQVLGQISGAFEGLAKNINQYQAQLNAQEQADLKEKQINMARIVAAQVKMAQDVSTANHKLEIVSRLNAMKTGIQDRFKDIPDQAPGEFIRQGKQFFDNYLNGGVDFVTGPKLAPDGQTVVEPAPQFSGISDPIVKGKLQIGVDDYLRTSAGEITNHWVTEQKTKNAFAGAMGGIQTLITDAGDPRVTQSIADVGKLQSHAESLIAPNMAAFGHEASTIMTNVKDKIAMNYFNQLLASDQVVRAKRELESGAFTRTLSAAHRESVTKELQTRTHAKIMEGNQTVSAGATSTLIDLKSRMFDILNSNMSKTQQADAMRALGESVTAPIQSIQQGSDTALPNPKAAEPLATFKVETARQAKALDNGAVEDARRVEADKRRFQNEKDADASKARTAFARKQKAAALSPEAANVKDYMQREWTFLTGPSAPKNPVVMTHLINDLQNYVLNANQKGYISPQDTKAHNQHLFALTQSVLHPEIQDATKNVIQRASINAQKWVKSLGAPELVAKHINGDTQNNFLKFYMDYKIKHKAEPNAAQIDIMHELAKGQALRFQREHPRRGK